MHPSVSSLKGRASKNGDPTNIQTKKLFSGGSYIERERERESNKISKLFRVTRVPKKSLIKLLALCTQNLVSAVQQPFLPSFIPSFHTKRKKYISLSFSLCLSQERNILGCYSLTSLSLSLSFRSSSPFQNPFGKSHSLFQHSNKIDKRVCVSWEFSASYRIPKFSSEFLLQLVARNPKIREVGCAGNPKIRVGGFAGDPRIREVGFAEFNSV